MNISGWMVGELHVLWWERKSWSTVFPLAENPGSAGLDHEEVDMNPWTSNGTGASATRAVGMTSAAIVPEPDRQLRCGAVIVGWRPKSSHSLNSRAT